MSPNVDISASIDSATTAVLPLEEITILTDAGAFDVSGDGTIDAAIDSTAGDHPMIAVLGDGSPVLLADVTEHETASLSPSSTARVLLGMDPYLIGLPDDVRDAVIAQAAEGLAPVVARIQAKLESGSLRYLVDENDTEIHLAVVTLIREAAQQVRRSAQSDTTSGLLDDRSPWPESGLSVYEPEMVNPHLIYYGCGCSFYFSPSPFRAFAAKPAHQVNIVSTSAPARTPFGSIEGVDIAPGNYRIQVHNGKEGWSSPANSPGQIAYWVNLRTLLVFLLKDVLGMTGLDGLLPVGWSELAQLGRSLSGLDSVNSAMQRGDAPALVVAIANLLSSNLNQDLLYRIPADAVQASRRTALLETLKAKAVIIRALGLVLAAVEQGRYLADLITSPVEGEYWVRIDGRAVESIDPPSIVRTPTNLVAAWAGDRVRLTWIDEATNEEEYLIQRRADGDWAALTTADAGAAHYDDASIQRGVIYSYRVFASHRWMNSDPSNEASVAAGEPVDQTPPTVPTNLAAGLATASSLTLTWTATGDDATTGTASQYDIRYSTSQSTAWEQMTQASGEPTPKTAGQSESFTVSGLQASTTYYFQMKVGDEVPNWSGVSNKPSGTTSQGGDTTPPTAVTTFAAGSATASSLTLTWTASGDDGTTGTASRYDIRYAISQSAAWDQMTQASGEPTPQASGQSESFTVTGLQASTTYYFQLKVGDEVPNWSGVSNKASGTTAQNPPPQGGFVLIPSGMFTMGSPDDELCRYSGETRHQVTLTKSFYMLDHEVTQAEWVAVMGTNPSHFQGDRRPVELVTWYDCVNYCNARSTRDGYQPVYTVNGSTVTWDATKNGYRLPTEAEWEYACRAGTNSALYAGPLVGCACDDDPILDQIGWYCGNADRETHDVMGKLPNAYGLYDMSGNVWEWCWDWLGSYPAGSISDPLGPEFGDIRVIRGGSYLHSAFATRSAYRDNFGNPWSTSITLGLRLARTAPSGADALPPAEVTDLEVGAGTASSLTLTWTATGDDGTTGTASRYDIRYATSQSTAWEQMTQVSGEPTPKATGQPESFTVTGLQSSTTYHFQMKVGDEVPNWSGGSNKPSGSTAQNPPPQGGFVLIPAGTFTMGSPENELCRIFYETPHQVTLTRSFYMLDHEVTQAEWVAVMGTNPSSFQGDQRPVEQVSWYDCVNFCNARSTRDGYQPVYTVNGGSVTWDATKNGYRLPTEAEWEYACRAGTTTAFYNGGISECFQDAHLDQIGWYYYNSGSQTHDVRGKTPNARSLYDMSGNVSEWCWDRYAEYPTEAVSDPTGPTSGFHVVRGGQYNFDAYGCRSADRDSYAQGGGWIVGFRLARTAP